MYQHEKYQPKKYKLQTNENQRKKFKNNQPTAIFEYIHSCSKSNWKKKIIDKFWHNTLISQKAI